MKRTCLYAFTFAVMLPWVEARAEDASDPQGVIKEAIDAAGGLDKLDKVQKQRGTMEGTYYGAGGEFPYTSEFAAAPPDKSRMEVQGVFTTVLNGDKGWISAGGSTQELTGEQLEEAREQHYLDQVTTLVPLAKHPDRYKLTNIEGEEVDGQETIGVQVSSDAHRDVKLYFDKDTHELVKAVYKVKSSEQGFAEVTQEVVIKGYMEVDGAQLPEELVIRRDGQKYVDGKVTKIEVVEDFPPDAFAAP